MVGPEVAPRDWVPVDLLPSLLAGSAAAGRDPVKLAREIGRVVAGGPFGRYDGEGIDTAEQLFADSRRYWPRYASWGTLAATIGSGHASIILSGGPREIAVCGFVEGLLERLAELAGGVDAKAWHVRCRGRGDEQCLFELRWSPPRALRQ